MHSSFTLAHNFLAQQMLTAVEDEETNNFEVEKKKNGLQLRHGRFVSRGRVLIILIVKLFMLSFFCVG